MAFFNDIFFRQAFQMFDSNHDGFIDMKELRQVTVMLGTVLSKEEVDEFMAEADKVENKSVKYNLVNFQSFQTKEHLLLKSRVHRTLFW